MIADSYDYISDKLSKGVAADKIIKEIVDKHGRVIFNGNNYSAEWKEEAAKRGLPNIDNTVDAYFALKDKKNIELLTRKKTFTEAELNSRYEILVSAYAKTVNIEAATLAEIAELKALYAVRSNAKYSCEMAENFDKRGLAHGGLSEDIKTLVALSESLHGAIKALKNETEKAMKEKDILKRAEKYRDKVISAMEKVRKFCDDLESRSDGYWPRTTYFDLLFDT
jgi:glutamine synthetase